MIYVVYHNFFLARPLFYVVKYCYTLNIKRNYRIIKIHKLILCLHELNILIDCTYKIHVTQLDVWPNVSVFSYFRTSKVTECIPAEVCTACLLSHNINKNSDSR